MTMKKAQLMAVAGIGGFLVGWLTFGSSPAEKPTVKPSAAITETKPTTPVPTRKEFPLQPADVQADRETPAVAIDSQGRILLAWATQTGDNERTLTLARSSDGGITFDPPTPWRKVPIYRYTSKSGKGKEMAYSTHVLPRLTSSGEAIHLGWVEAIDGGPSVAYFVATSTDGGKTWAEPIKTHGQESVKPGFTGMAVGPDGAVLACWLDGRVKGQRPYASVRNVHSDGFEPEQLVFEGPDGKGVCPCCDVSIAQAPNGSKFVGFRNNDDGNRDIVVALSKPGESNFGAPVAVTPDHWKLNGCPHDGPSLAVVSDRLNLVWMDAHTGKNRVYHASSPTSELAFTPRELTLGSTHAQGHPKLAASANGRLLAVWDESLDDEPKAPAAPAEGHGHGHGPSLTGGGRAIMLTASSPHGFGPSKAIDPRPGAFQIQPSIALSGDGTAFVVWNELDEHGKKVVCARIAPEGQVH